MVEDNLLEPEEQGIRTTSGATEHPLDLQRAALTTASAAIAHAVLLLLAFWLLKSRTPGPGAPQDEVLAFYRDPNERRIVLLAGIYMIPFAGIAFIWFIVALRMWVVQAASRIDILRYNILLVCGVVYITLIFAAGASMSVLATSMELGGQSGDPTMARIFLLYGTSLFLVFAMRMASMVVTTMTAIGRKTGILPRWLQFAGTGVAIGLMLTSSFNSLFVIVFPLWLLIFGIFMLKWARKIPGGAKLSISSEISSRVAMIRRKLRISAEQQKDAGS